MDKTLPGWAIYYIVQQLSLRQMSHRSGTTVLSPAHSFSQRYSILQTIQYSRTRTTFPHLYCCIATVDQSAPRHSSDYPGEPTIRQYINCQFAVPADRLFAKTECVVCCSVHDHAAHEDAFAKKSRSKCI